LTRRGAGASVIRVASRARSPVDYEPGDELLAPIPLAAIALFGLNNFVLKRMFGGFITGKLSDVLACFFLPLFVSSTIGFFARRSPVRARVAIGCVVSATAFAAVKVSPAISHSLDRAIAFVASPIGTTIPNRVDPTDLVALPIVMLAYAYARARFPDAQSQLE